MTPAESSGLLTASAQVRTGIESKLMSVMALADGTNEATIIVHDAAAVGDIADSNIIAKIVVDAGLTMGEIFHIDAGVQCNNGLYVSIAGTGAEAIVLYRLG